MHSSTSLHISAPLLLCSLALIPAPAAHAQWTTQSLHPVQLGNAASSQVMRGKGGMIGGRVRHPSDLRGRAAFWNLAAGTYTELSKDSSFGYCTSAAGSVQAGYYSANSDHHACIWSGSQASLIDLNPAGFSNSFAMNTDGVQQVGYVIAPMKSHAALWSWSAGSFVNLHPSGATESRASGVWNEYQAGRATIGGDARAGFWTGTAASWTLLAQPAGAESSAACIDAFEIGGVIRPAGATKDQACVWSRADGSYVILHDPAFEESSVYDVDNGVQVGWVFTSGDGFRASLWTGTPESRIDLSSLLPSKYTGLYARGVWNDGTTLYVVGTAHNTTLGRSEAMLWTRPLICPADFNGSGFVDTDDYDAFIAAFETGLETADFDLSGFVDTDDFTAFVLAFEGGC